MSFALAELMCADIDERVKSGAYGNSSEHQCDPIRRDQEELARQRLRELMEDGLSSSPARAMTRADRVALRKAALGRKG